MESPVGEDDKSLHRGGCSLRLNRGGMMGGEGRDEFDQMRLQGMALTVEQSVIRGPPNSDPVE